MTNPTDYFAIVANVVEGDRVMREGGKMWILQSGGANDSCRCRGLSKGGRCVTKWVALHRLETFRAKWVPPSWRDFVYGRAKADAVHEAMRLDTAAQRQRIERLRRAALQPADSQ